jgi:hypothetical protein
MSGNVTGDGITDVVLSCDGASGGAICNAGDLVAEDCAFYGNVCGKGGYGGSLSFYRGANGVSSTDINGTGDIIDTPGGRGGKGGAIYNSGNAVVSRALISSNTSGHGGDGADVFPASGGKGGDGGAVYNSGLLLVNASQIVNNYCGSGGKGASTYPYGAGAGGDGGDGAGIFNKGYLGLSGTFMVNNAAGSGGTGGGGRLQDFTPIRLPIGGNGGVAGGFYSADSAISCVTNSLIVGNLCGLGGAGGTNGTFIQFTFEEQVAAAGLAGETPDVMGPFSSGGSNSIGNARGSTGFTNGVKMDIVGTVH